MRFDYINPLVTTTQEVLDCTLHQTVSRGEVVVLQGDSIYGDVVVSVRITGDSEGDLLLSMDDLTALRICSTLTGDRIDTLTPENLDALVELGNMIAGNAVSALNDLGFDFSILPPEVSVRTHAASSLFKREALRIPLMSDCGEVDVNVFLGAE